MKKLLFTLFLLGSFFTLSAQTRTADSAKREAMELLREEGYAPKLDEDDDIALKIQGFSYYIIISGQNDGSLFVTFGTNFSTDQPYQKILEACNVANRSKNVIKYYTRKDDDGDVRYYINYESFINPRDDFRSFLRDALALLPAGVEEFLSDNE